MPVSKDDQDDAVATSPYKNKAAVIQGDSKTSKVSIESGSKNSPNSAATTAAKNAAIGNTASQQATPGAQAAAIAASAPQNPATAPSTLLKAAGMNYLSTPDEFNAYANTLDGWARYLAVVNAQSEFVMTIDKIDAGGIPTFKPLIGADGQKIPQSSYAYNKAQIDRLTNQNLVDMINATGEYKDISGKMQKTPTAILQQAQSDNYKAQAELSKQESLKAIAEAAYISGAQTNLTNNQANLVTAQTTYTNEQQRELARRYELDRQNALAQAVADPRRSVEAAMMMQLYGANQGGMPVGTGGYSAQGLAAQAPQYGGTVAQGFAGGAATQGTVANTAAQGVQAAQVAPAGWPSPTGQMPSLDAANGVGGYSAAQLAQARQNAAYVVNPNLAAALGGQYVPAAGNKSGSYGQITTVAGAAPSGGNYGKINPVSYRNMDADTKARYGSLALANQGLSDQDIAKRQQVALPGSSLSGSSRL